MIQIPVEIVKTIASYVEQTPPFFVHLARVSQSFYTVFMSDELWQPFNVNSVDLGIAQNFIAEVKDKERALAFELYTNHKVPEWMQLEAFNSVNPHVQLALIYYQLLPYSTLAFSGAMLKGPTGLPGKYSQMLATALSEPLEIFSDRDTVLHLVSVNGINLKYATAELQGDQDVVLAAIGNNGKALQYANFDLRSDPDLCIVAGPDGFPFATETIWANHKVLLDCLRRDDTGTILSFAPEALRDDWEIAFAAVTQCGKAMEFVSPRLKCSRELVLSAKHFASFAYKYADSSIKNDKDFVIELLKRSRCTVYHLPESLKMNFGIVLEAVKINGEHLCCVPYFMDDEVIVRAAVENTPHALAGASPRWRNNKDLVLSAVERNGYALVYASDELRNDRDVVHAAVLQYGKHIRDASETLRKDPEIIAAACVTYPLASEFGREDLSILRAQLC